MPSDPPKMALEKARDLKSNAVASLKSSPSSDLIPKNWTPYGPNIPPQTTRFARPLLDLRIGGVGLALGTFSTAKRPLLTSSCSRRPLHLSRSKSMSQGAGCLNWAGPDLWEPWVGNNPGPSGRMLATPTLRVSGEVGTPGFASGSTDPVRISRNR